MRYYSGPWQWHTIDGESFYGPPVGAVGAIDLGTLPEMGVGGVPRKGCLCWTNGAVLGSDYDLLGTGHVSEIARSGKIASVFEKTVGAVPNGDHLHAMIMDCLIGKADPDGNESPMPIMPGIDGWMDLHMQGHGRVKGERFEWGRSPHTTKIRRMLRREFAGLFKDADEGKLKDRVHHRRVLDDWCCKYGVDEWREFVPDALQADVPGRVKRETTYTDDFNRADSSTTLGTASGGGSWTNVVGVGGIVGNKGYPVSIGTSPACRLESDLSSSDHYCQFTIDSAASGPGQALRFSSSATTFYHVRRTTTLTLFKCITGTFTSLGTPAATGSVPYLLGGKINGSSLTVQEGGSDISSVTDTAIASGLRVGFRSQASGTSFTVDGLTAEDLAASGGILYTQLEHGTRGIARGTYHKF